MSASGKKIITAIMSFSVAGSLVIAGPLMFNLDAARDGGEIQNLAMDSALWKAGNEIVTRTKGGDEGNSNGA